MNTFARFFSISFQLIPPFTSYLLTKTNPTSQKFLQTTVTIRQTFQHLGSTFIKLGQMLSARPDIVGPQLSNELRNLLDKEPVIPESQVKTILEKELDAPLHAMFDTFDMTPLASASIG